MKRCLCDVALHLNNILQTGAIFSTFDWVSHASVKSASNDLQDVEHTVRIVPS